MADCARTIAKREGLEYVITDGPPGIGCPVISSLSGADLTLLVTEPTLSGMHDLERVLGVCNHFNVPALVCVNKCDINVTNTLHIKEFCHDQGVDVVSEIPVDNAFVEAVVHHMPIVEYARNGVSEEIGHLWETIVARCT